MGFDALIQLYKADIDIVASGMTIDEERSKVDFTAPYVNSDWLGCSC